MLNQKLFTIATLILILGIAFSTHAYNMFGFPYFENDEGTYMSQAWSLIESGQLAPYTYWYDHAPLGWILLALWTTLTGGFFTFGLAVDSGRVFMLLIHVLNTALIFSLTHKLTKSNFTAFLAGLVYILTPLGIYFHRRVLLDNIMLTFALAALRVSYTTQLTLTKASVSALLLACSVLTKETAIFFVPAIVYQLFAHSPRPNRSLFLGVSGFIFISTVSLYFLYALIKTELFPSNDQVSLLGTLLYQSHRGSFLPFWDYRSDIYTQYFEWFKKDPFLVPTGLIALALVTLQAFVHKHLRTFVLAGWGITLFFLRGGLVIDFYVVPLLPFLTIAIALVAQLCLSRINGSPKYVFQIVILILCTITWSSLTTEHYTSQETTAQRNLITHIKNTVNPQASIAIDAYALVDLRAAGYQDAQWFWKIWTDPQVYSQYQNIEYIALTHEMVKQLSENQQPPSTDLIKQAYQNGQFVFYQPPTSPQTFLDLHLTSLKSTNGDWAALIKNTPADQQDILTSWQYYKSNFIKPTGQILDPQTQLTTSEAQAYALKRARQIGDLHAFETIWLWTKEHLQKRPSDQLFAWLAEENGQIRDFANASDADLDIAYELLLASKQWHTPEYSQSALLIINDLWQNCIVQVQDSYYLLPNTDALQTASNSYLLNPSYLDPLAFKLFATYDLAHPWTSLVDDSYKFLFKLQGQDGLPQLPPNWILLNIATGQISSARDIITSNADDHGFDAFRTFYRVATDYYETSDLRARDYLSAYQPFFESEIATNFQLLAIYAPDGTPRVQYDSISAAVGGWSVLQVGNSPQANTAYQKYFVQTYHTDGYFGDAQNYYDQNWAALATNQHYLSVTQPERGDRL